MRLMALLAFVAALVIAALGIAFNYPIASLIGGFMAGLVLFYIFEE